MTGTNSEREHMQPPSLTIPSLVVGPRETPPDLVRWLYQGGAATKPNDLAEAINAGLLGELRTERLELVRAIHQVIVDKLAGGGSQNTARNRIKEVNQFVTWSDVAGAELTIKEASDTYVRWTEYLLHRCQVKKELSEMSVYDIASKVGDILDNVLGRQKTLIHLTRVRKPASKKAPLGPKAEKQHLESTFAFGRLLQDICDSLAIEVVWGSFDVQIQRANGEDLKLWTGGSTSKRKPQWAEWEIRQAQERVHEYIQTRSLEHRGRKAVVNLRILAELLMFIGQTAMNLAQAHKLKLRNFSYSSDIDGYKVRDYKHRRGGEVLFEIFTDYRQHFERYLAWRRELFPDSPLLFPVIREGSLITHAPRFDLVIGLCKKAGVPWTPPATLRGTRVNWLLRRSGNIQLTADAAQHSKETLLAHYDQASLQRSMSETTRFWDHLKKGGPLKSVGPGACDGEPSASPEKPPTAPEPDCTVPTGCLWCEHHRDIDTADYVWELVSFRHLKIFELSKGTIFSESHRQTHPAKLATDTLSAKLSWFRLSNAKRRVWVEKALALVDESRYHPAWERIIKDVEGE